MQENDETQDPESVTKDAKELQAQASPSKAKESLKETLKEKIILIIVETVIIGSLSFLLGQYYNSLKAFEDVKWERAEIECLDPGICHIGRERIFIYRLGEKPINDVRVLFSVTNSQNHEIIEHSIQQYEKSILNFISPPEKYKPQGNQITFSAEDPERNNSTTYGFNLSTLSPEWIYELTLDIRSKNGSPFKEYSIFQLRDSNDAKYDHKNLALKDYLRLYLVEALIASIVFLLVLIFLIWKLGSCIFYSKKGAAI